MSCEKQHGLVHPCSILVLWEVVQNSIPWLPPLCCNLFCACLFSSVCCRSCVTGGRTTTGAGCTAVVLTVVVMIKLRGVMWLRACPWGGDVCIPGEEVADVTVRITEKEGVLIKFHVTLLCMLPSWKYFI